MAERLDDLLKQYDDNNKRLHDGSSQESSGGDTDESSGPMVQTFNIFKRAKLDVELPTGVNAQADGGNKLLAESQGRFLGTISRRMFSFVQRSNRRYISLVHKCKDDEAAKRLCQSLYSDSRGSYSGGLFILRQHGSHVHSIHLCTYNSSRCRCSFIEKAKARADLGEPVSKFRRKYAKHLDQSDCTNIILYFFEECRRGYNYFECDGYVERFILRNKDIQKQGYLLPEVGDGVDKVEACFANPEVELLTSEQLRSLVEEIRDPSISGSVKIRERKKRGLSSKIMELIMQHPTSPTKNICNHIAWLENDELQYLRQDNRTVQNVIDSFCHLTCKWSINEFWDMYNAGNCEPAFNCYNGNITSMYYTLEESLDVLDTLLLFQFNDAIELVQEFLQNLYDIIERKKAKCNSILVYSPPSAGKNFFFDTILCFLLNKGQLGNPNKHNNFAYQELYGKRIVLWNEPNYEAAAIDTLKMVLGGDDITVSVKCKPDMSVEKTPVIILTNKFAGLMSHPAFVDRIKQYTWKAAPYLKDLTLKPYPLAVYLLFEKYGIIK